MPTQEEVAMNYGKQFCFMAFDLLFIQDRSILEFPLKMRLQLLKRVISTSSPKRFEIVEQESARTTKDIVDCLDRAIVNRDEGIIVKVRHRRWCYRCA